MFLYLILIKYLIFFFLKKKKKKKKKKIFFFFFFKKHLIFISCITFIEINFIILKNDDFIYY